MVILLVSLKIMLIKPPFGSTNNLLSPGDTEGQIDVRQPLGPTAIRIALSFCEMGDKRVCCPSP